MHPKWGGLGIKGLDVYTVIGFCFNTVQTKTNYLRRCANIMPLIRSSKSKISGRNLEA